MRIVKSNRKRQLRLPGKRHGREKPGVFQQAFRQISNTLLAHLLDPPFKNVYQFNLDRHHSFVSQQTSCWVVLSPLEQTKNGTHKSFLSYPPHGTRHALDMPRGTRLYKAR